MLDPSTRHGKASMGFYCAYGKRALDLAGALAGLLLLSPLFALAAAAIKLDSRGPILFRQERVGRGLSTFTMVKFRTMTDQPRTVGNVPIIGRAPGVTRVGYWLRRTKLDETPQLLAVLRGDLSLVGPRPGVPEQLPTLDARQKGRYNVRPGLTGLAQVTGNIHLSWPERIEQDLLYASRISLRNDLTILARTVLILFKGEVYFANKPLHLATPLNA